jgi:hypothetical protein
LETTYTASFDFPVDECTSKASTVLKMSTDCVDTCRKNTNATSLALA